MEQKPSKSGERQPKLSSDKALPASCAEKLLLILKGYVIASSEGANPSGYKEIAALTDMNPTEVSKNNAFLEENGFVTFVRRGLFLPEPAVVRFVKEEPWDAEAARIALQPIVARTWFAEQVRNLALVHHGQVKEDQAISALGRSSGAPSTRRHNLVSLVDLLVHAGLVTRNSDGTLAVLTEQEMASTQPATEAGLHPIPRPTGKHGPGVIVAGSGNAITMRHGAPAVQVTLTIGVPDKIDDAYLDRLAKILEMLGCKPE